MHMRIAHAAIICCLAVLYAADAVAQAAPPNVTFEVPLNLTQLPSQILKVRVNCSIQSNAFTPSPSGIRRRYGELEMPVSQAAVVQTAQVIVNLTDQDFGNNPSGQPATYSCELMAFETTVARGWAAFHGSTNGNPLFFLTPTPPPTLNGSFVW